MGFQEDSAAAAVAVRAAGDDMFGACSTGVAVSEESREGLALRDVLGDFKFNFRMLDRFTTQLQAH